MKRDRLKEIKEWKDEIDLHGNEISERNFLTLHVEWLIEQAERVEELEEEVQDISVWNHGHRCHIHKLKQQNERYHDLLESIRYTPSIAQEIYKEQPDKKFIDADDLLQHILRKINKELEESQ